MRAKNISVAIGILALISAAALALSRSDVYYGNRRQYTNPASVNARAVFTAIPAYREIIERNIDEGSALYLKKLEEANRIFNEAIVSFAESNGYDLICEEGALDDAPLVTDQVVRLVRQMTGQ